MNKNNNDDNTDNVEKKHYNLKLINEKTPPEK